jgi:HEPN domain-containing protein
MGTLTADSGQKATQVLQWLGWADKDYISARTLLLEGHLIQGMVLSNTAVEKYFKAVCFLAGLRFPKSCHDVPELHRIIRSQEIKPNLNTDYLSLLKKAYELRYPDNLSPGYNICLGQAKLLTELDHSVFEIRKGFDIRKANAESIETRLSHMLKTQDKALMDSNSAFGDAKRDDIFREKNGFYELRVLPGGIIMEAEYQSTEAKDDGVFDEVALKPGTKQSS